MKKLIEQYKYILISCASVAVVLLVWYIAIDVMKLAKSSVFPGLEKTVDTFLTKLVEKKPDGATLGQHLLESLKVCLMGYSIGALLGVPLDRHGLEQVVRLAGPPGIRPNPAGTGPGLDTYVYPDFRDRNRS